VTLVWTDFTLHAKRVGGGDTVLLMTWDERRAAKRWSILFRGQFLAAA
jgi:hypothetical protein